MTAAGEKFKTWTEAELQKLADACGQLSFQWDKIAEAVGKPEQACRSTYYRRFYIAQSDTIPESVLAERDKALSWVGDLTARLMGDPPPNRSALGRLG